MINGGVKDVSKKRGEEGYTLTELLAVLVILALIATFAAPQVMQYLGRAKSDTARVQIDNLSSALDLFYLDNGRYPTSDEGLRALVKQPDGLDSWAGPYVKREVSLNDPWGEVYGYASPGEHGAFDLYSFGADKEEGGEQESADLTNW